MSNLAMPGLVKIGFSTKDPILRAKELDGTGLPHPFIVEYSMLIDEPFRVEQHLHKELHYCHENKEFFRLKVFDAISAIKECVSVLGQSIHFDEINNSEFVKPPIYQTNVNWDDYNEELDKAIEYLNYKSKKPENIAWGIKQITRLAEKGMPRAQYKLGILYYMGDVVERDVDKYFFLDGKM